MKIDIEVTNFDGTVEDIIRALNLYRYMMDRIERDGYVIIETADGKRQKVVK